MCRKRDYDGIVPRKGIVRKVFSALSLHSVIAFLANLISEFFSLRWTPRYLFMVCVRFWADRHPSVVELSELRKAMRTYHECVWRASMAVEL